MGKHWKETQDDKQCEDNISRIASVQKTVLKGRAQ